MKTFFDSNILIDHLAGLKEGLQAIRAVAEPHISVITYMEVLSGCKNEKQISEAKDLLSLFTIHELESDITELSIIIRRDGLSRPSSSANKKLKLPDAIIFATSRINNGILETRNTKDFSPDTPGVRIPYTLRAV